MWVRDRELDAAFHHVLMFATDDRSLPTKRTHAFDQFGSGNR